MSEGEGFLSRWSRRKRGAAVAAPPSAPAAPPEAAPPEAAAAPSGAPPAFDPASLPPLESLTAESDFAAFLRDEVPAALRRAALRRAWTLDPSIRDFVGPADYAWDYNAPGGVPGFSLEVPKDLERLIAQAIGSGPPAAEEEEASQEAPPPAEAAAAAPQPEPLASEGPTAEAASAEAPVGEGPAPEALPAPVAAAPIAEAPPVRRRHGGAVPS
jgi:hypothetical protein